MDTDPEINQKDNLNWIIWLGWFCSSYFKSEIGLKIQLPPEFDQKTSNWIDVKLQINMTRFIIQ